MVLQKSQDLLLGMVDGPESHLLGQGRGGQACFDAEVDLQREDRCFACFQGFITNATQFDGTKKRSDLVAGRGSSSVTFCSEAQACRRLLQRGGFQVVEGVLEKLATDLPKMLGNFFSKSQVACGVMGCC